MKISLNERKRITLKDAPINTIFKLPENDLLFAKIDISGLMVRVKEGVKPIDISDGSVSVICMFTGKAQWLNADEEVEIVVLEAYEVVNKVEK